MQAAEACRQNMPTKSLLEAITESQALKEARQCNLL
jgi:hypothetical protein